MTFIQIILLVLVLVILWRLYQRLAAGELTRREFVEWFLLWLAAGYLVIVPETSSYLAAVVGVGRGSDLVVYLAIILVFYLLFKIFLRLERSERALTTIYFFLLENISTKLGPYLPLFLRLGLGFIFFWSGLSKIVSPESAIGVCTNRGEAIDLVSSLYWLPFDPEAFVWVQSYLELFLGAALLVGFWVPLSALVSVIVFLLFFVILDFSLIWKNVGLLGAVLALLASEPDRFSLDSWLKKRRAIELRN